MPRPPDVDRRREVQELLDLGLTGAEIARKLGVSGQAVYQLIKRMRRTEARA